MAKVRLDTNAGQYIHLKKGDYSRFHHIFRQNEKTLPDAYRSLLAQIPLASKSVILDIGGGTGEVGQYLAERIKGKAITTDISNAGFTVSTNGLKVQAEATMQPFPSESFDVVHTKDALVHIDDIPAFLLEVSRILKPHGIAILTTQEVTHGRATLYYGVEPNEALHVPIQDKQDYETLIARLRTGGNDEFLKLEGKKQHHHISPTQPLVSVSPPYYTVQFRDLIELVRSSGFTIQNLMDYKPSNSEDTWMSESRKVLIVKKIVSEKNQSET